MNQIPKQTKNHVIGARILSLDELFRAIGTEKSLYVPRFRKILASGFIRGFKIGYCAGLLGQGIYYAKPKVNRIKGYFKNMEACPKLTDKCEAVCHFCELSNNSGQ
jgi:hypothetical protein